MLVLRFAQDLSYDEIAAVRGRTPGALRQLARRAPQTLRKRMMPEARLTEVKVVITDVGDEYQS